MIADDTTAIREAMRKLSMAKAHAKAEAARKAETDASATEAPAPAQRPLFDESGAPFRGFFVTEDGSIKAALSVKAESNFDQEAWDAWDDATLDSGLTADTASLFMWGKL